MRFSIFDNGVNFSKEGHKEIDLEEFSQKSFLLAEKLRKKIKKKKTEVKEKKVEGYFDNF